MNGMSNAQGWDAIAMQDVATKHYGSLESMFEAHEWDERGQKMLPALGRHVKETYGGVPALMKAHKHGLALNPLVNPLSAIEADPSQVFLKSFHGFTPETWGFLGYTKESSRDKFIAESKPGALVVICATGKADDPEERLKVLGIQQQTHVHVSKWDYLSPERHASERADLDRSRRWLYGLKAVRAWRIVDEDRPFVRDIFPHTHKGGDNGTAIGAYGLRLQPDEAKALLDLRLVETELFNGNAVDATSPVPASDALRPSIPGPVSQSGFFVREAEGPKHLYILRLKGAERDFLGYDPQGCSIVKVGFSHNPSTRCKAHNSTLPACAFKWSVLCSTSDQNRDPFPSSSHALAGEAAMKSFLDKNSKSLGGEFFLADEAMINRAWQEAISAAESFTE